MNRFDEEFSVDDILNEVTGRASGGTDIEMSADADRLIEEILKEQLQKSGGENVASASKNKQSFRVQIPEETPVVTPEMPKQPEKMIAPEKQPDFSGHIQTEKQELPPMMRRQASRFAPFVTEQPAVLEPVNPRTEEVKQEQLTDETYHPAGKPAQPAQDEAYLNYRANRAKKIKDFVLLGEEEEVDEQEAEVDDEVDQDKVIEEFDSMEDAPSVFTDLKELATSISIRFGLLLVLSILNLYPVLANAFSFFPLPSLLRISENPVMYSLVSLMILVIAVIVSHTTVLGGLLNFFKLKADGDSLPALSVLFCMAECIVFILFPEALMTSGVHLYSFAALLGLLFNCIGKLLIVKRTMLNFKYVTSSCDKYATSIIEDEHLANDLTKGVLHNLPVTAINRKTGFLTGFLDMSFREDLYDGLCRRLTPIIFIAAAILAVSGYMIVKNIYVALTVVAGVFAVCSSFFGMFSVNLPLLSAVKAVHKHGGMLIGYPAAEEFSDVNSATAQGSDLFPAGSVVLHGIKTFKGMRIDDAILDAASILVKADSILSDIFLKVIQGKPELLKEVDTIVYEDMMGISGWVDNKRVLIGNRELMLNHGIDVPSKDYEKRYCTQGNELVYLSTSGELTAVFIVSLKASIQVADALRRLQNNDVFLIVKTVDAILTKEKLAEVFEVEPALFKVIPARLHKAYDEQRQFCEKAEGFLANNGTLYSYAKSLTVAKRLRVRIMLGIVVLLTSVIIGFGMITALCLMNGMKTLSVLFLVGYQLIWFVIAWLIQKVRSL